VAAEYLNPEFADIVPTPVRVEIVAAKKKWLNRTATDKGGQDERPIVILAPKFPLRYSLVETLPDGRKRAVKPALWPKLLRAEGAEIAAAGERFAESRGGVSSIRGIDGYFATRKITLPRTDGERVQLRERFLRDKGECELAVALARATRFGELGRLSEHRLPFGTSEFELARGSTWQFTFEWFTGEDDDFRGPDSKHNVTATETREADGRRVLTVKVGPVPQPNN
jgi:hypothetical protein